MYRKSLFVLSAVLALPITFNAIALDTPSVTWGETKTSEGTVKSVDTKANSFVLAMGLGKDAKEITVKVNGDTKYTLDGKSSTMEAALKAGNKAKVKHTDNTATQVDATTPKHS